jgi:hypothetical protein
MAGQTIKDATPAPIRLTNVELGRAMGRACDAWQGRKQPARPNLVRRLGWPKFLLGFSLGFFAPIGAALTYTGQIGFGFTIENGHADAYVEARSPVSGLTHGYRWCSDPESMQARADVPPE